MKTTEKIRISQNNLRAALTVAVLFLCSLLLLLSGALSAVSGVAVTFGSAKTLGAEWNAFVAEKDSSAASDLPVYAMDDIYTRLYAGSETKNAGIIGPDADGKQLLHNKAGQTFDYVLTVSSPMELVQFSYLTVGLKYTVLTSITADPEIAAFFRAANVRLGRDLDFAGETVTVDGITYPALTVPTRDDLTGVTLSTEEGVAALSKGTSTVYYATNALYEGFGATTVPQPVLPVSQFTGVFDGQNFEIRNLRILRNAKAEYNPAPAGEDAPFDALFASVLTGGIVKNVGLTDARYSAAGTLHDGTRNNKLAGVVGFNRGSVTYAYSLGAQAETAQTTFTAVGKNGAGGTAGQVYSAGAALTDPSTGTVTNPAAEAMTADGNWYTASDLRPRAFNKEYSGYPRLAGLKKTANLAYQIRTPADFAAFSRVFNEGQIANNTVVTVANDLDMSAVSDKAILPMADMAGAPAVTLTGAGADTTDPAARATVKNLKLNAYLYAHSGDNARNERGYGLFFNRTYSAAAVRVNNLNFYGGGIEIGDAFAGTAPTCAGLVAAWSKRPVSVRNVGGNFSVTAADGVQAGGNVWLGGFVGRADNSNSTAIDGETGSVFFRSVAYSGTVSGGARPVAASKGSVFAQAGFVAYADSGQKGITFTDVYAGGKIYGVNPTAGDGASPDICTGALLGYGYLFSGNAGNTPLRGVYADAEIHALAPASTAGDYTGGIPNLYVGALGGNWAGTLLSGADAGTVFVGSVNASDSVAGNASEAAALYFGGLAGKYGGTASDLGASLFSDTTASPAKNAVFSFGEGGENVTAAIGGLFGAASGSITNAVNDRDLTVSGVKYKSLSVAGLSASGTASFAACVNTGNLTVSGTLPGGAKLAVSGVGYDGSFEGCVNGVYGSADKGVLSAALVSGSATNTVEIAGISNRGGVSYLYTDVGSVSSCNYAPYKAGAEAASGKYRVAGIGVTSTVTNAVNYGSITVTPAAEASSWEIGGVTVSTGQIYNGINNGAITFDADAPAAIGGIAAASDTYANSCINNADLKAGTDAAGAANAHAVFVGGIKGEQNGGSVSAGYNLGAVTVGSKITAPDCAAGGIAGKITSGTLSDSTNAGAVTGANCGAGGIAGGAAGNGVAYLQSLLNYGVVSGADAGGVLGVAQAGVLLSGAVNYGAVSAAGAAGGIVGAASGYSVSVGDAVNYGAVSGASGKTGGIAGTAASKVTLNMTVHVDPSDSALPVAGDTAAPSGANQYAYDTGGLDALYGEDFILHPTRENVYYTDGPATTGPTLVWSEKPYLSEAGLPHAPATAAHCFAVTTTGGRRTGEYAGQNYQDYIVEGVDSLLGTQIVEKLRNLKQIDYSRDVFPKANLSDNLTLYDASKGDSPNDKSQLPALSYSADTATLTCVVVNTSPFYINNAGAASGVTLDGAKIDISGGTSYLSYVFSSDAGFLGYDDYPAAGASHLTRAEFGVFDEKTSTSAVTQVLSAKLTVYQGAKPEPDADGNVADGLYAKTYVLNVFVANTAPSAALADWTETGTGGTGRTHDALTLTSGYPTETEQTLDADKSGGKEQDKTYALTAGGADVPVAWNGATLTAGFAVSGIDRAYLLDKTTTTVRLQTRGAGEYTEVSAAYFSEERKAVGFRNEVVEVEGSQISIPAGTLVLTVRLTDLGMLELPYYHTDGTRATYKLTLSFTVSGKTYTRSFTFTKEQSDDNQLHYGDNGLRATGGKGVPAYFATLADPGASPETVYMPGKTDYTAGRAPGGTGSYAFTFKALNNDEMAYGYGAFPSLGSVSAGDPLAFFGHSLSLGSGAKIYVPGLKEPAWKLDVRQNPSNPSLLSMTYSFSVVSEKGSKADYSFTYNYPRTPELTQKVTDASGAAASTTEDVSRTGGKTFTVDYTHAGVAPSDGLKLSRVEVWYTPDAAASNPVKAAEVLPGETLDGTTESKLRLPVVTVPETDTAVTAAFSGDTTGGTYLFKPVFQYRSPLNLTDIPAFGTINLYNAVGGAVTELTLSEYTGDAFFTVNKTASRNSYLLDFDFSGAIPSGATSRGYLKSIDKPGGELSDIAQNPAITDKSTRFIYENAAGASYYVNPGSSAFFGSLRTQAFQLRVAFPDDVYADGSDYSTLITLRLNGEIHYVEDTDPNKRPYNDEYANAYLMTQNADGSWTESETPLGKTLVYLKDDSGGDLTDANGEKIVDYAAVQLLLPEGALVRVRVRAENPHYYTDYEFVSTGPLRNKTFKIGFIAPETAKGNAFVATIGKLNAAGAPTRSVNLLLKVPQDQTGEYVSPLQTSTHHTAGKYRVSLYGATRGYKIVVESIAVEGEEGSASPPGLVFEAGSDTFEFNRDTTATLTIVLRLIESDDTGPWGDVVFG